MVQVIEVTVAALLMAACPALLLELSPSRASLWHSLVGPFGLIEHTRNSSEFREVLLFHHGVKFTLARVELQVDRFEFLSHQCDASGHRGRVATQEAIVEIPELVDLGECFGHLLDKIGNARTELPLQLQLPARTPGKAEVHHSSGALEGALWGHRLFSTALASSLLPGRTHIGPQFVHSSSPPFCDTP